MQKNIFTILILFFFLKSQILVGQNSYKVEIIKSTDELPSNIIISSTKFNNYLYISTQRGISMYDGYEFIKNPYVKSYSSNLLWNNKQLYYFEDGLGIQKMNSIYSKPKNLVPINFQDKDPNNNLYDYLFIDKEKHIWYSEINNINFLDQKSGEKSTFLIDKTITKNIIRTSHIEPKTNEVWVSCHKGVFIWNNATKSFTKHPNLTLQKNIISSILIEKTAYFSTSDGKLMEYNVTTNESKTYPILNGINDFFSIAKNKTNNHEMILYSSNKIVVFNCLTKKTNTIYTSNYFINHVLYDEETKQIWVSTINGLIKLNNTSNAIENLMVPSNNLKTINSIEEDSDGTIWISNQSNIIYSYKSSVFNTLLLPKNTTCNQILSKNNALFFATNTGVFTFENKHFKKIISSNYNVKKIAFDNKNQLWLMPEKGNIEVFDYATLKKKDNYIKNNASFWEENSFNDIIADKKGKIWLACWIPKGYGICFFDDKNHTFTQIDSLKQFNNTEKFISDYYNYVSVLNDNSLLFSGYGGWNKVTEEGNIIKTFDILKHNVVNHYLVGIAQDKIGNIWFGCAEGLYHYNTKTNKSVRLSQIDGLASNDITNGFKLLKNNKLAIGTDFRLQIIDLEKILKTQLINKLELTSVNIDGKIISNPTNTIKFNYDYTSLELSFSSLSFSEKEKIIYRYKFDDENKWHYLGSIPKLSLIKLSSGNYNLTIQAGDNLGNFQSKELHLNLEITPPFYYTSWFITLLILFILLIAFLINRYLVNQEKEKGNLKRKISESEMQTLRSQMNPHFLFNSLNSINSFIVQQKSREASSYLTTFSKLMRNILENSRYESITLEKEINTLKMYLEIEAVRLEHKFDYEIIIDKNIELEFIKIPPLIIQPFAENAIWHGLNNKPNKGLLKIEIQEINENCISISIIDDGIGRKAAALLKKEQLKHKSYGIDITINRLQLVNSKNNYKIIDLPNDDIKTTGTKVELQIYYDD
jgi:ligand-binding sensor domain-containing protein